MSNLSLRPTDRRDEHWIKLFIEEHWGAPFVVAHGEIFNPHELNGFIAELDGDQIGLVTYRIQSGECEIVTLNSIREKRGVGSALISVVVQEARRNECTRIWLITTNDNLDAMGFYQKRGFRLIAVHPDALARSRVIKPQMPERGAYGIPLRDEIEFEMVL